MGARDYEPLLQSGRTRLDLLVNFLISDHSINDPVDHRMARTLLVRFLQERGALCIIIA